MYDVWKVLRSSYSYGSIVRAILVKLSKNSKIDRHIDGGKGLEDCIRHHIPIITNKKVLFTVDDETINMKAGEIWRIDNLNKYDNETTQHLCLIIFALVAVVIPLAIFTFLTLIK